jgi:putative DNA primase/helicase
MLPELCDAIRAVGYEPPSNIAVGKVTRFSTNGKRNDRSGWVHVFDDGKGAVFGCWRSGEQHQWHEKRDYVPDIHEQEAMRQQFEEAKRKAIAERDLAYSVAAKEAQVLFDNAVPVVSHDYLTNKGIRPNMARVFGGKLIIPVYGVDGNLQSVQSIFSDGAKRFHSGGKMAGGHCWIGDPSESETLLIAEGFATADSLHQATDLAVCIAFNAGNLKPVTQMLASQYIGKKIVICADNDSSGVGINKAKECGVDVVLPTIDGDFNDMMSEKGIDAVRDIVFGKVKQEGLFITIEDMMASIKKPNWLIKGILERGSMNLLFGESGAGKSLFAMDWAFCAATGRDWHGHKIKEELKSLIIMGEGLRGASMRFKALSQKYGEAPKNIRLSRRSINLLDSKEADDILKIVAELDFKPDIIIIDTLHRNMVGDENSSEDMAMYFKSIELLARRLNAAIITVHHSGHGDKGRSRGSSSIKAAMDAEFCVTKNGEAITFSCTKSKDFGFGTDMSFFIKEVELEGDVFYDADDDKQITSVYLEYQGVAKKEKSLPKKLQKALDSLVLAAETIGKERPELSILGFGQIIVSLSEWKPFFIEDKELASRRQNFSECRKELIKQGFIGVDGDYSWIL